jgi:hypothetical protein
VNADRPEVCKRATEPCHPGPRSETQSLDDQCQGLQPEPFETARDGVGHWSDHSPVAVSRMSRGAECADPPARPAGGPENRRQPLPLALTNIVPLVVCFVRAGLSLGHTGALPGKPLPCGGEGNTMERRGWLCSQQMLEMNARGRILSPCRFERHHLRNYPRCGARWSILRVPWHETRPPRCRAVYGYRPRKPPGVRLCVGSVLSFAVSTFAARTGGVAAICASRFGWRRNAARRANGETYDLTAGTELSFPPL